MKKSTNTFSGRRGKIDLTTYLWPVFFPFPLLKSSALEVVLTECTFFVNFVITIEMETLVFTMDEGAKA